MKRLIIDLSTGVRLAVKPVSVFLIDAALGTLKRPEVPIVHIESKDRDETNPADPRYVAALQEWAERRGEMVSDLLIQLGTAPFAVPADVPDYQSDAWRQALAAANVPLSDDPGRRYLEWVKFVAIGLAEDYQLIQRACRGQAGTPEEEVLAAMQSFPGDQGRGPHLAAVPK